MGLKLGMTGMDSTTEADLKGAVERAQSRLAGRWQLVPEADADHVIVDMDSMYGPMSWIRLHAAGKQVIGLTTSPRTQADHHLLRPFDDTAVADLLATIADSAGLVVDTPAAAPIPETPKAAAAVEVGRAAPPSASTPAPAPASTLPEEQPAPVRQENIAPPEPAAALEPESVESATSPPAPARDPMLADWLATGALAGRWRYARDGVSVLFDNDARVYHGPPGLKALAGLFEGTVQQGDLQAVDQANWSSEISALGEAQPLTRLQWLGGLVAGKGTLLPGTDPNGQYRLVKWPQTEREYPKHFRIATAMMKGPATLEEVAAASGVPLADVADFVNANLATGYAEFVPPAAPAPTEPPKPSGLFGRMRGR